MSPIGATNMHWQPEPQPQAHLEQLNPHKSGAWGLESLTSSMPSTVGLFGGQALSLRLVTGVRC